MPSHQDAAMSKQSSPGPSTPDARAAPGELERIREAFDQFEARGRQLQGLRDS